MRLFGEKRNLFTFTHSDLKPHEQKPASKATGRSLLERQSLLSAGVKWNGYCFAFQWITVGEVFWFSKWNTWYNST